MSTYEDFYKSLDAEPDKGTAFEIFVKWLYVYQTAICTTLIILTDVSDFKGIVIYPLYDNLNMFCHFEFVLASFLQNLVHDLHRL